MASPVWRSLQCQLQKLSQLHGKNCIKSTILTHSVKGCVADTLLTRMASARTLPIAVSRFGWTRFKNDLHMHFMLGAIPLGAVIFYANFFVGESELVDIPEGYEPKEYEYHKHPIQRWFAKYVYDDPVKEYEMGACKSIHTFESARHNARLARVKEMMAMDQDYRSYYFIPAVDPRSSEHMEKYNEEIDYGRGNH